jgi:hypothetical protein
MTVDELEIQGLTVDNLLKETLEKFEQLKATALF